MIIPWPFSPLVLRPALWLDASDASTLYSGASLAAADGAISEWRDKSGWNRHASQATGVSQPLRKTGIQNGKDVVRFDGANDKMIHGLDGAIESCTIFIVAKQLTVPGSYRGLISIGSGASGSMLLVNTSSTKWGSYGAADLDAATDYGSSAFRLACMMDNAASGGFFYLDSVADGTWSGNTVAQSSAHIGGDSPSQASNSDFAEILAFPTALSDADRAAVESYLNAKWAIY